MDRAPGRRVAIATIAVLAGAGAVGLVVTRGDEGESVAARRSTTSTVPPTSSSTLPSTTVTIEPTTTTPAPATTRPRIGATERTTTPAAPGCPPPARGSDFDGFGAAEIVIENNQGSHRSCVLAADTPAQRQQGLMRQDDLDGYDGMIFLFPTAEERSFWMRNTSIPLSIAFFDAGGGFVSAADMEPCGDSPDCPSYPSRGPAKYALEVTRGRLSAVGATSGSRLHS